MKHKNVHSVKHKIEHQMRIVTREARLGAQFFVILVGKTP